MSWEQAGTFEVTESTAFSDDFRRIVMPHMTVVGVEYRPRQRTFLYTACSPLFRTIDPRWDVPRYCVRMEDGEAIAKPGFVSDPPL